MLDRFFTHRGLRLHLLDHGGDGPPVVLLHGGSAHARWWDFVVPHLGAVHAYALDLRGHGDSGWAKDGAYRIADYAADVARLIERFRLERPALVGHSLGSFVALRYAVDHPRALAALVMVDGRASFGVSGARYLRLLAMLCAAGYDSLEEAVGAFCPLPKETVAAPQVIAHVARHGFRQQAGRWTAKFDRATLLAHEPFDLRDRLGSLRCPVLFVRGEHSTVISRARLAELAAACRQGSVVELAGCHHQLPLDRPDRLGAEIRAFLRGAAAR